MPRLVRFAVFLSVLLLLVGSIHAYLWLRLVHDPGLPSPWRLRVTWTLVAFMVLTPATLVMARALRPPVARWVVPPGYTWLGLMFLLFVLLLATDAARVLVFVAMKIGQVTPGDAEQERRIARVVATAVVTLVAAAGAWGILAARGQPRIREVHVELPNLPAALDGTIIVQLTDIHIGPTLGRAFLSRLVRRTNDLGADVIAITGDLVDGPVAELAAAVAPLADLRARHGVYFVTGNHEYYAGATQWVDHVASLGVRVLRNERVSIGDGVVSFDLAGVDDLHARGMARGHGHDLPRALAGRDPARALVLLAHQPKSVLEAARHGVGLQLSGHTHGGQIWPFRYLTFLQQPYVEGLHRHGDTLLYVSRGCGYWGPPMRVNAPAEIARIVLHARRPEIAGLRNQPDEPRARR